MARVEGVGGYLYNRGFERLRCERRLSFVTPTAIALTSTASTAFFLHLPSTACVSLLAHYCITTMEIPYSYRSLRPTEICVRLFFLRWEIPYSYRSLRPTEICVRLSIYDEKFPIRIAVSV